MVFTHLLTMKIHSLDKNSYLNKNSHQQSRNNQIAGERTPCDREFVGSIPAQCYFLLLSFHPLLHW